MKKEIIPIMESYNVDEWCLYSDSYMFLKGYFTGLKYENALKALPLARNVHNGQYRKNPAVIDGKRVQLPYLVHCLKVCSTLVSLDLPLSHDELDVLYSASLLHDVVEDRQDLFPNKGKELIQIYDFPEDVYCIVSMLSKYSGADEYELNRYFNEIKKNKLALLIKVADRSHNVEDLYCMKNIEKYIQETRVYFLDNGLCHYAKAMYPELSNGITILKSKILSLTEATETLIEKNKDMLNEKESEIKKLENQLRKETE